MEVENERQTGRLTFTFAFFPSYKKNMSSKWRAALLHFQPFPSVRSFMPDEPHVYVQHTAHIWMINMHSLIFCWVGNEKAASHYWFHLCSPSQLWAAVRCPLGAIWGAASGRHCQWSLFIWSWASRYWAMSLSQPRVIIQALWLPNLTRWQFPALEENIKWIVMDVALQNFHSQRLKSEAELKMRC